MAQLDNIDKIDFSTAFAIDKIVQDEATDQFTLSGGAPAQSTETVAHSVGTEVLVNGTFSIDGTNFYPFGTFVDFIVTCYAYADSSSVYFDLVNADTGSHDFDVKYVLESTS